MQRLARNFVPQNNEKQNKAFLKNLLFLIETKKQILPFYELYIGNIKSNEKIPQNGSEK